MPRKRHTAEQIIGLLRQAEVELAQGRTAGEIGRGLEVPKATFYSWRCEYGGLTEDQARRLKDLERENARLKRAVAEMTLDKQIVSALADRPPATKAVLPWSSGPAYAALRQGQTTRPDHRPSLS